ncbi:MAG: TOMM precursor leader peptide-binding protein [Anaerolineae bacterium]|nr:TOMM precursor leader peptide-binding protein [Anaerolineae bacterium]
MMKRPRFKPHLHAEVLTPETVFLLSEGQNFLLHGRLYGLLAPWLNGQHTADQIIDRLQDQASPAEIEYALTLLSNKGYLTETDNTIPEEEAAFWSLLGIETSRAARGLRERRLALTAFGAVPLPQFTAVLESLQIHLDEDGELGVVITDDYLRPGLAAYNQAALQAKRSWMLVKPVGATLWLGPIFQPGQTGCWACLTHRLAGQREVETCLRRQKDDLAIFPTSRAALPTTMQLGLNLAATEIAKWLVEGTHSRLEGRVITLDTVTLTMQHHCLTRRPQCPACGDPDRFKQEPQPLTLTGQKKIFILAGGYRTCQPEQTLQTYARHISPITGVVGELRRLSEADNNLVHVYLASHYFPSTNLDELRLSLRNKSAGKGRTDSQAKASGLGEAIERYSGIYTGDEYCLTGRYTNLADTAIHPRDLLHFSLAQYEQRQVWNSRPDINEWVPQPFDETKPVEWTPAWSLTTQTFKHVPLAYCYYGYPLPPDHQFCWADSNGNAAGNNIEEAILQGFLELVERDSVAVWWYNRISRPAIDLDSFDEPYLLELRDHYRSLQRDLWVLDITADLEIPTFVAVSAKSQVLTSPGVSEDVVVGFGAHLEPKLAALRAVTELNQLLWRAQHPPQTKQSERASLAGQSHLKPAANIPARRYTDFRLYKHNDLREDVEWCVNQAARLGLETLVVDQTRPDIGLNVVKVIVPGLRYHRPRLGSGRLYDVPVKLGWLDAPLTEEQLNLCPLPV